MAEINVTLPKKVSSNEYYRFHWGKKTELKARFYYAAKSAVEFLDFEVAHYPLHMRYTFYLKGRLLDATNLFSMVKMIEDGFVKAGFLRDDSSKYISYNTVGCKRCKKGVDEHVIVELFTSDAKIVQ